MNETTVIYKPPKGRTRRASREIQKRRKRKKDEDQPKDQPKNIIPPGQRGPIAESLGDEGDLHNPRDRELVDRDLSWSSVPMDLEPLHLKLSYEPDPFDWNAPFETDPDPEIAKLEAMLNTELEHIPDDDKLIDQHFDGQNSRAEILSNRSNESFFTASPLESSETSYVNSPDSDQGPRDERWSRSSSEARYQRSRMKICPKCGKPQTSLSRHKRVHDRKELYKCPIWRCRRKSPVQRYDNLMSHMKDKHLVYLNEHPEDCSKEATRVDSGEASPPEENVSIIEGHPHERYSLTLNLAPKS